MLNVRIGAVAIAVDNLVCRLYHAGTQVRSQFSCRRRSAQECISALQLLEKIPIAIDRRNVAPPVIQGPGNRPAFASEAVIVAHWDTDHETRQQAPTQSCQYSKRGGNLYRARRLQLHDAPPYRVGHARDSLRNDLQAGPLDGR